MSKIRHNQKGFSAVETLLVIVFIALVGFVGWYVYHSKQTADKNLVSSSSQSASSKSATTQTPATATDNQSLQSDLGGVNSANGQTTKDLNTSGSGLNDSSTFTSVPQ